jgi:predicted DNA-binding antitoxin AbrB/MazE fold protein
MKGTQVTDAIYADGVLKPVGPLELREAQRVRIIVETLDEAGARDREAAFRRLLAGIESMNFVSQAPLPKRDELHDRP